MNPLPLRFVHDFACPWCYLGFARLRRAAATEPPLELAVEYVPFQLDPGLPPEGVDATAYLSRKFGDPNRVKQVHDRIADEGKRSGVEFDFERRSRLFNTLPLHLLMVWASDRAPERKDALAERLYRANFAEGLELGKAEVLECCAEEAGLDGAAARASLSSKETLEETRRGIAEVRRAGINGVPLFLRASGLALSGAHPEETLRRFLTETG